MLDFPFLKEETIGLRTQETFIGTTCEIYIPEYFIDKNDNKAIAVDLGDKLETIGLFYFKVDSQDLYELQLPLKIQFKFSNVEKKKMRLKPEFPEMSFFVYTLKRGDAFIFDSLHKQDADDLKSVFLSKLIEGAKLPAYVSYQDALDIFLKAMIATNITNLGISAVSIEFMLSELYRNKHNMQEPFRLCFNGRNAYDYKMVRITKVPQLNSTFTGITGEDVNNQLVSAIVRNRTGSKDTESPIEEIIKY